MRHLHQTLAALSVSAVFLAGCAGAPETNSGATGATPPPQPSRSQPAPSAPPRMQQPADPATVDNMTVFEMQERLNELGYKVGTVDGVSGARTVEALKKFQSDNKLTPTGAIDPETARKLRAAIK